ncbi:MAG: peptide deformylase [Gammaproteobacteria bacterium]|jgi:peptide deformylase
MALLPILEYPDPRLRMRAKPVTKVDDRIRRLIDDMLETMYAAPGIGLAANQVDVQERIIVIDVSEHHNDPVCLVNPEILEREGTINSEEGCLSVPDFFENVDRAQRIRVRALDREGEIIEFEAEDILAVCIQHEMDHLDGKLFVDYLSSLKRERVKKRFTKRARRGQAARVPESATTY